MEEHSKIVSLSIGTNLGNKAENLNLAIKQLELQVGQVLKISDFYHSEPWGFSSQNNFINCCCLVRTNLKAEELLLITQKIESELGRLKLKKNEYEDRIVDIDIIFYDNQLIQKENIRIPHQNFKKRDFVLIPLQQISNEIDPETFISVRQFTN